MAGKISDYPAKITFDDTDLYDCSTTGTNSEAVTYGDLKGDLKNTFHTQGGNSYGADLTVGTNDANDVVIETQGSEAVRIDTTNNVDVVGGIQLGENIVLAQDEFWAKKIRFSQTIFTPTGSTQGFNLAVLFDDLLEVSVFIKSISGHLIPPKHTVLSNSFYDYYISKNTPDNYAYLQLKIDASETNFDNTSQLIVTSTYKV